MKREIIIGDNESDGGEDALALGRILCGALSAEPVVISVVEFPHYLAKLLDLTYLEETSSGLRKRVDSRLPGLDAELRSAVSESPGKILSKAAEDDEPLAVVVGSTDRGTLGSIYPGSAAISVLQGGPSAVAIAPRGYRETGKAGLERIAIAYDGSPESQQALEAALTLARRLDARLSILTVINPMPDGWTPQAGAIGLEIYERNERQAKERVLSNALDAAAEELQVEGRLLDDEPATALAQASKEFDLMLVGSRGYGPVRRAALGTVSAWLTRSAHCPLLVLPRGAGDDPLRLGELETTNDEALSS